jgi:DNA invertase Pin-like site-specific DNA recombinase
MTSRSELAGVWVRVSAGGQDEVNQIPDIEQHCAAHGYSVTRRYELNDKSASKGEQQEKLDEMLTDMRDGTIRVLVCWHSDRLERRGPEYVFRLLAQARDADGRIESTKEPLFGAQDMSGEAMTALGAVISHQYTVHLSEQVKLAHDRIRANGGVGPGGTAWGLRIEGPKYNKKLVPTDLCREYAPQIFDCVIAGDSWRAIAAWLDVEGVPTKRGGKWNEGSIRKLVQNRVYAGRLQNEAKTKTLAYCEPVISPDTFDRAQDALKRRPHRGPMKKYDQPMLANLKCARCEDSPMYRIRLKSRDGKFDYLYYRCAGRGAQRKGCGNMVAYKQTEIIVATMVFMRSTDPYQVRYWVEGTNWDAEISDIKQDMREAVEAEQFDALPKLRAKLEDLRGREAVKGHWEYEETGMTVGDYFDSLDTEGKREYLKIHDIRVDKATPTLEPGASNGVRVILDGEDHGVFPYPTRLTTQGV